MASFGLRGHGNQPQYDHELSTLKGCLHVKFIESRLKSVEKVGKMTLLASVASSVLRGRIPINRGH